MYDSLYRRTAESYACDVFFVSFAMMTVMCDVRSIENLRSNTTLTLPFRLINRDQKSSNKYDIFSENYFGVEIFLRQSLLHECVDIHLIHTH